ncbi:MAG: hypothetical protein WD824_26210 [Cyclobacteriaceae bacterium]
MEIDMKYLRCCALIGIALLASFELVGQAKVRKLSAIINHPSLNLYAPYVSADANALVFLSDNAEDNALTPFFSFRENADWKDPQVLPKNVNTRLNFLRGYGLSADGRTLFFSTMKSPGVGGFDICTSDWKGSAWTNPVNLGAPINSRSHEACASLTPDGKTLYFMRCERMDQVRADQCKLFRVDKKSNGLWGEPVELPEIINAGNSQTPRIMADAETLIFSSDKMGSSKGGMDLYATKFRNGGWTDPVPLAFANTEKDDQYVSVTGLGRYLVRDSPGGRKNELMEYLIPGELRPKGMMKIEGKAVDPQGKPVAAYISLVDIQTGERKFNGRPNSDGTFLLYAMEGSHYELAIDPEHGKQTYYSKLFDLTHDHIPQVEKVNAVLKPLMPDDELVLGGITFKEYSGEIDLATSERELKRFTRTVTSNPDLKFEVQVLFEGYQEDSLQSSPDLTQMMVDTVYSKYVDIDTLGQLYERDTMTVKTTYHNDRTVQQAESIVDYLVSRGANSGNIAGFVNAIPAIIPENKKTMVKARVVKM